MGFKIMAASGMLYLIMSYPILNSDQESYIDKYKGLAIREMERSGVPASITLAQGLLESNSGKSDLATKAKNHFGIKCGSNWKGRTMQKKDDDYKNGRLVKSCFRAYPKVEDSYRDHSDFLRNGQRYQFLFDLDQTNYKGWAKGLKKAGYATSKTYHKKLIDLIEAYDLDQYDKMSSGQVVYFEEEGYPEYYENSSNSFAGNRLTRNDVKYVLASEGQTLTEISADVRYSTNRLMRYNEGIKDPAQPLAEGEIIYIQPKRLSWRGREKYHVVKPNQTMYDISQEYGLSLEKLYQRNRMENGSQPAVGERVKIRGSKVSRAPKLGTSFQPIIEMNGPASEPASPADPQTLPEITPQMQSPAKPIQEEPYELPEIEGGSKGKTKEAPKNNSNGGQSGNNQGGYELAAASVRMHEVSDGETLWSISRQYGLSVDQLRTANQLDDDYLRRGMQLRIP